jgi:hypothetical protein
MPEASVVVDGAELDEVIDVLEEVTCAVPGVVVRGVRLVLMLVEYVPDWGVVEERAGDKGDGEVDDGEEIEEGRELDEVRCAVPGVVVSGINPEVVPELGGAGIWDDEDEDEIVYDEDEDDEDDLEGDEESDEDEDEDEYEPV